MTGRFMRLSGRWVPVSVFIACFLLSLAIPSHAAGGRWIFEWGPLPEGVRIVLNPMKPGGRELPSRGRLAFSRASRETVVVTWPNGERIRKSAMSVITLHLAPLDRVCPSPEAFVREFCFNPQAARTSSRTTWQGEEAFDVSCSLGAQKRAHRHLLLRLDPNGTFNPALTADINLSAATGGLERFRQVFATLRIRPENGAPVSEPGPGKQPKPAPTRETSSSSVGPEGTDQRIDEGKIWRTIAGTTAAGLAAAAAALAALGSLLGGAAPAGAGKPASKGGKNRKTTDRKRTVGFLLQLSRRRLDLKPGDETALTAAIWKVDDSGRYIVSDQSFIRLRPTGLPDMTITPNEGSGLIEAGISVSPDAAAADGTIAVHASAEGSTYRGTVTVSIVASSLDIHTHPSGKRTLAADGVDQCWIMARLNRYGDATEEHTSDAFTFTPEGSAGEWLELGVPHVKEGWTMVLAQTTLPEAARGERPTPPTSLGIGISCTDAAGVLHTSRIEFAVPTPPTLEIDPERIELASGSRGRATIRARVENPGEGAWLFRGRLDAEDQPLVSIESETESPTTGNILVEEAGAPFPDGEFQLRATLRIFAEKERAAPLERRIPVFVAREGLFLAPQGIAGDGTCVVAADGSGKTTDIEFRVFIPDPSTGRIVPRPEEACELTFDLQDVPDSAAANVLAFGRFTCTCLGVRAGNIPTAAYRLGLEKAIPTDGKVIPATFRVSLPGLDGDAFSLTLRLSLRTSALGVGGKDWQIELEKCQKIISDYVPTPQWPKLQGLLDRRKMVLGPEGLFELRRQIWKVTGQFILAEGERAFDDQAAWENRALLICEWVEWGSDLAFESIATAAAGPHGGLAAKLVKDAIKSALVAYSDGQSADQWFDTQLMALFNAGEGQALDRVFEIYKHQPAACWALFVGYAFIRNLAVKGDTLYDAARGAIAEAGTKALGDWMVKRIVQSPRFADFFKVDVPKDKAVFWSGEAGRKMAESSGGSPLGGTRGGKWGDGPLSQLDLDWPDARTAWENLSRRYAQKASGRVQVYLPDGIKPDSIFARVEYPALLKNRGVTSIEIFVKKGDEWVKRNVVKGLAAE